MRTSQSVSDGFLNREDTNLGTVRQPEAFCLSCVQRSWENQSVKRGNEADAEKNKDRQRLSSSSPKSCPWVPEMSSYGHNQFSFMLNLIWVKTPLLATNKSSQTHVKNIYFLLILSLFFVCFYFQEIIKITVQIIYVQGCRCTQQTGHKTVKTWEQSKCLKLVNRLNKLYTH